MHPEFSCSLPQHGAGFFLSMAYKESNNMCIDENNKYFRLMLKLEKFTYH